MDRAHTKGRERPILFSAPMVRALLEGRKTQTRRIAPQPAMTSTGYWHVRWQVGGGCFVPITAEPGRLEAEILDGLRICVGDRLWVREAWRGEAVFDDTKPSAIAPDECNIRYEADGAWTDRDPMTHAGKLRPSMFMPRWASRLTLTVTDLRVQRLQDISGNDAQAEGIRIGGPDVEVYRREADRNHEAARRWNAYRIRQYRALWEEINGAGSWNANPWVAAYTFTVEHRNIDEGRVKHADATPNPSHARRSSTPVQPDPFADARRR